MSISVTALLLFHFDISFLLFIFHFLSDFSTQHNFVENTFIHVVSCTRSSFIFFWFFFVFLIVKHLIKDENIK